MPSMGHLLLTVSFGALTVLGCSSASDQCREDNDCPAGRHCSAGSCVYECSFDTDCPAGFRCSPRGRCERGCTPSNGGVEACDGADNDCDDLTDEDYIDLGLPCQNDACPPGAWQCKADGQGLFCDGPLPAAQDATCDGLDEDCDGDTDEDAQPIPCPLQGGVCAGASQACLPGGVRSECDYGPGFSQDVDDTCDQQDNDCDGQTDEDGIFQPVGEFEAWATDGIDNNCNGLVDEPGGVMVRVPSGAAVWIDAYETTVFADPGCTGQRFGEAGSDYPDPQTPIYACALPGLIPSGWLTWPDAQRACAAQGKRLCTSNEYGAACNAGASTWFPYGQVFVPGACNDALHGAGQATATGSHPGCCAGNTCDMSGNLAEWFSEWDPAIPGTAFVGGWGFACLICAGGVNCRDCIPGDAWDEERIHYISDCNLQESVPYESFQRDGAYPFIGARCCLDGP